ncbi:MAG: hypothetical protein HC903_31305 [Methylacidiphilales bacterium]|nr:hypothetical protein [Candidatus Methylacidiphilales bacterium]
MFTTRLIKNSKSGRSGSLKNLGCQVAIAQSQGYDPRELVWCPKFIKNRLRSLMNLALSKMLAGMSSTGLIANAVQTKKKILDNTVAIIQNPNQMELLFDMDLEASSICVDGMTQREILAVLNPSSSMALPAAQADS